MTAKPRKLACLALLCGSIWATACSDGDEVNADDAASVATEDTAPDISVSDVLPVDAEDAATLECPGGPGCPCVGNGDCDYPKCIATPTGSICARKCVDQCAVGFKCVTPAGDSASLCLPAWGLLCRPCSATSDCAAAGVAKTFCVAYGTGGAAGGFCGASCTASADCPTGYVCKFVPTLDNGDQQQCIRESPKSDFGECTCDPFARKSSLSTTCWYPWKNATGAVIGRCNGRRVCGDDGLGACMPLTGTAKLCEDQQCAEQPDGTMCDDGDPCTKADKCKAGACAAGDNLCACRETADCAGKSTACEPLYCNTDQAPYTCDVIAAQVVDCNKIPAAQCSVSACDPTDGKCKPQPASKNTGCDDKDACTAGDTCDGTGTCVPGSNLCGCVADGDCAKEEDGDTCNGTLYCDKTASDKKDWQCKLNPGTVVNCPTLNEPCRESLCAPKTGECATVHLPVTATCNDADSCTGDDRCDGKGGCAGTTDICPCTQHADCAAKDDGDLCNGVLYCDKAVGGCKSNPASVVTCPTADNTGCATSTCAPKTGTCSMQATKDGKLCDDGDPCVQSTACKAGQCGGGTNTCACDKDADCATKHGGDLCIGTFYCDLSAIGAGQQSVCRVNPVTTVVCPTVDDTACRRSTCAPKTGKCALKNVNETGPCDADGNPCTAQDRCKAGECEAGANLCTCTKSSDCANADDGNACNGTLYCDKSAADATKWACAVNLATAVTCDASSDSVCSKATCVPATGKCGLKAHHVGEMCDDGEPCTAGDKCIVTAGGDGQCAPGSPTCGCVKDADCGKFDADLCGPKYGCALASKKCVKDPATAVKCPASTSCKTVACAPKTGKCVATLHDGKACADADACLGSGKCAAGACDQPIIKTCDDGNACTDDSCDGKAGCVILPNNATCSDGYACTVGDVCKASACVAGLGGFGCGCAVGKDCGSGLCVAGGKGGVCSQPCVDSCPAGYRCGKIDAGGDAVFACLSKPACVDKPGLCDDGNPCTDDACDVAGKADVGTGCVHLSNAVSCSDGDVCTGTPAKPDQCAGSACESGLKSGCDDGQSCTVDSCDAVKGCVALAVQATCSDGDACTVGDACGGGVCLAGTMNGCDDGNVCTKDSCEAATGCKHADTAGTCVAGGCTYGDQCAAGKCQPGSGPKLFDVIRSAGATHIGPHALKVRSDRRTVVFNGRYAGDGSPSTFEIATFSAAGKLDSAVTLSGAPDSPAVADMAFLTGSSSVWVFGSARQPTGPNLRRAWAAVVDANGKVVVSVLVDVAASDVGQLEDWTEFSAVDTVGDTAIAVGGGQTGQGNYTRRAIVVAVTNGATVMWKVAVNGPKTAKLGGKDTASAILAKADGSSVLAASTASSQIWLASLSKTGALVWSKEIGKGSAGQLWASAADVMVGARHYSNAAYGYIYRVNSSGSVLSSVTLAAPDCVSHSFFIASSGFITGVGVVPRAGNGSQKDICVANYSAAGQALGWKRLDRPKAENISLGTRPVMLADQTLTLGIRENMTGVSQLRLARVDAWGNADCFEAGLCAALSQGDCSDDNPCTLDWCAPKTGCTHAPLKEGASCGSGATCAAGVCK